jgi:hypothetical protein
VAIAHARGDYIALLDSDDMYLPYALELLVGVLGRFPNSGFAYADFLILRAGRPPFGPGLGYWHGPAHRWEAVFDKRHRFRELDLSLPAGLAQDDFDVYTGDIYGDSLRGPQVPTSSSMIRRSLMGDLRFPESDSLCGDWEFFARLSRNHGAVFADVPTMLNRSRANPLTRVAPPSVGEACRNDQPPLAAGSRFLARHRAAVDVRQFDLLMALVDPVAGRDGSRSRDLARLYLQGAAAAALRLRHAPAVRHTCCAARGRYADAHNACCTAAK